MNLVPAARQLRREQTLAEAALWRLLRGDRLGLPFRRQHVIGRFVVDFCCPAARLVIELDGAVHDADEVRTQDAWREEQLRALGYDVIRFWNDGVLQSPDLVIEAILAAVRKAGLTVR
jgi:very-short-patch-repair endonuclease